MRKMTRQSTEWGKKYLQIIYLIRVWYPEYKKNLKIDNKKTIIQLKDGQKT